MVRRKNQTASVWAFPGLTHDRRELTGTHVQRTFVSQTDQPVILANEKDLDALLERHSAVLLELYTDGCGICASMEPILSNVARTTDTVVATLNPRDDPPLVDRFDVRSVPKFVCFVDGGPVAERADGFVPHDELVAWIDNAMG